MAEHAIATFYMKLLGEEKIDAIGRPTITITKIARGNPLGVKIVTAVFPKVELPDYKKIAEKINDRKREIPEVTDKDVEDTILEVSRNYARHNSAQNNADRTQNSAEEKLPELTDDSVKRSEE